MSNLWPLFFYQEIMPQKINSELTEREQATVLAALRYWQAALHGDHSWAELSDYQEIASNLWQFEPLSSEEIERMVCKFGGMPVDAIE